MRTADRRNARQLTAWSSNSCPCIVEASEDRPYLALTLDFDFTCIADLLLDASDSAPYCASAALAVSPLWDELLDPAFRVLRLLDPPGDIPVMAPLIEREILYRPLQGCTARSAQRGCDGGSHLSKIRTASAWIRAHYAEPFSVEALAERAGTSITSFHRHFKAITTMSPLQYRTRIRLQEARRLPLLEEWGVGMIGFVGYDSVAIQPSISQSVRHPAGSRSGASPSRAARRMRITEFSRADRRIRSSS